MLLEAIVDQQEREVKAGKRNSLRWGTGTWQVPCSAIWQLIIRLHLDELPGHPSRFVGCYTLLQF